MQIKTDQPTRLGGEEKMREIRKVFNSITLQKVYVDGIYFLYKFYYSKPRTHIILIGGRNNVLLLE